MTTKQTGAGAPGRPVLSLNGKITLLLAAGLALLATPLVSPAMPDIAAAFAEQARTERFARWLVSLMGMSPDAVNVKFLVKFVLLSVPALFIVVSAPLTGWVSDHWGRRKLLLASLFLFAAGGTWGYFATTFLELFLGRMLLGIAVGGIKTCTVTMVGDYFTGQERNRFIGWQGSAMKVGGVVFLLLGGMLAEIHWRVPFWGYLLSMLAVPGVIWSLYDILPAKDGRGSAGAAAKAPLPVLSVCYVFAAAFIASVLFFITLVQLPFFLDEKFAASPTQKGAAIALANLAGALISVLYYRFKARLNYVGIFSYIFLMIGLGYSVVVISPSYAVVLVGMAIAGCGFGLIVPNQSAWMLAIVPAERRGLGIGIVTTALFLGQFAAAIAVEPFIDPQDPGRPFAAAAAALFVLCLLYGARALMARDPAPS